MAPRKLSDSDKGTIVELYKQPGQTTTTLAEQYGVSNSTISRILKMSIPAEDYRALVSQKRTGGAAVGKAAGKSRPVKGSADDSNPDDGSSDDSSPGKKASPRKGRKTRSRKTASAEANKDIDSQLANSEPDAQADEQTSEDNAERNGVAKPKLKTAADKEASSTPRRRRRRTAADEDEQLPLLAADSAAAEVSTNSLSDEDDEDDDEDDLTGLDETLGDDFGDDDDLDEDLDDDDEDDEDEVATPKPKQAVKTDIQIMPLGEAVLPKPCYLVVDMRAELITRPLIEFSDLGKVPSEEERAKTLPVFDNHRVARRFSRNKQRVIKVPDGSLITRTSPYLAAKGITRLLVDGQVFDLADTES